MNKLTLRNYLETNAKYKKLKKRFDRNVKSGSFYDFSKKKQRSLMYRLRKLYEKLLRLKNLLKLATAGATMALALTAGQANAQDFKMQKPFKGKFKTELNGQKNFESDLFLQVTGLNNPFGGENPFDGQIISEPSYANFVDIDNDGDLDVVSFNYDYSTYLYDIKFYKNTGNNIIANLVEQTGSENPFDGLSFNSRPYMSFVDIDNDADFDMFINNQSANEIYYYENNGTAELPEYAELTGGDNPLDGIDPMDMDRLNFADIDNDGDLDVFIGADANYPAYPYLYRNTGTVTDPIFTPEDVSGLFDNTEGVQESLVLSDLDNDGDLDAVINGDEYYENQGDNTTPAFVELTGIDNPFADVQFLGSDLITLLDIDDDSDLDLLFGNGVNILYYENTGTSANAVFEDRNAMVTYNYVTAPGFVDIDNDGDYDMFIAGYDLSTYEMKVNYFKNVGTDLVPEYEQQFGVDNPMDAFELYSLINYPEFADIDNDGDFDLILGTYDNSYTELIQYYKNIGTADSPEFQLQAGVDNPFSEIIGEYAFISLVDIDNDGDLDLFQGTISGYGSAMPFYRNTGTNTEAVFTEETSPIILPSNIYLSFPDFVDIDDDGDYDLFTGVMDYDTYTWKIKHYQNMGTQETPAFAEMTGADHPLDVEMYIPVPVFVDIDADSDQDCFIGTYGGQLLYFRNKTFGNSVEDIAKNNLKLYPNPTNGIVVFETEFFNNEEVKVDISDLTGKAISNYKMIDYNKIDLSDLKAGIYFVKISSSSVSEVSKIVVQ